LALKSREATISVSSKKGYEMYLFFYCLIVKILLVTNNTATYNVKEKRMRILRLKRSTADQSKMCIIFTLSLCDIWGLMVDKTICQLGKRRTTVRVNAQYSVVAASWGISVGSSWLSLPLVPIRGLSSGTTPLFLFYLFLILIAVTIPFCQLFSGLISLWLYANCKRNCPQALND
jgi:hypothetical protein